MPWDKAVAETEGTPADRKQSIELTGFRVYRAYRVNRVSRV